MSATIKDNDKGWKAYKAEIDKLKKKPFVKVGFTEDIPHEESGESLNLIASSNEFGTKDGRIPERSFMRSTFDANTKQTSKLIAEGYDKIIKGRSKVLDVLNLVGVFFQGSVQKTIAQLDSPANAESTANSKGSNNPLVDTGFMRQSVKFEVKDKA